MVFTGAHAFLRYGWEGTTLGSLANGESVDKKFGLNDRFTSLSTNNNRINIPALNRNTLHSFAYGQQSGTANVSFILGNPWIFGTILGAPTTSGSSTYTHVWDTDPSSQTFNLPKTPRTIQIDAGVDRATDVRRTFKGCLVNSLNISTSVGGSVDCTADITYGLETAPSTTLGSAPTEPSLEFPFTFAHAELTVNDTVLAQCQDVSINIAQNAELLYGLNSHSAKATFKRLTDITGSFTAPWVNETLLGKLLDQVKQGSSGDYSETVGGTVELKLVFQRSATEKIEILGSGLSISDYNVSGFEATNPLFEDISWQVKNIKVTATNTQSEEE